LRAIRNNNLVIDDKPGMTAIVSKLIYATHYCWTALDLGVSCRAAPRTGFRPPDAKPIGRLERVCLAADFRAWRTKRERFGRSVESAKAGSNGAVITGRSSCRPAIT
jgi:hypothetical protein